MVNQHRSQIRGPEGLKEIEAFIVAPFKGVLCLFLLDMGLIAGRGLRESRGIISVGLVAFGILMPIVGSLVGVVVGLVLGLSTGGVFLFMVLSASYIEVPAAMRVAVPEANPSIYLTLSLGITFPFNLTLGLPLYLGLATALTRR